MGVFDASWTLLARNVSDRNANNGFSGLGNSLHATVDMLPCRLKQSAFESMSVVSKWGVTIHRRAWWRHVVLGALWRCATSDSTPRANGGEH